MNAYVVEDSRIQQLARVEDIRLAHAAGKHLFVDIEQRTQQVDALLAQTFHIHPLSIEDVWVERSSPKIDVFPDYGYVVIDGVRPACEASHLPLELWVVNLLVGRTFVITQHGDSQLRRRVAERLEREPRLLARGPSWLVHAIVDEVVDPFLPIVGEVGKRIDAVEAAVIARAGYPKEADQLPAIFNLKRSIEELCRITSHQRGVLVRLAGGEFHAIPTEVVPYFRDVADHFGSVADRAEADRDTIFNALDAYLGVQANRMSSTVLTLTLMSAVVQPLTLIASIYGMNFVHMPERTWRWGYAYALTLMLVVAIAVLVWFRHKRWL